MRTRWIASLALAAALLATAARAGEPPKKTQALLDQGKASFERNCATCHGPKGEGDGIVAAALNPKPRNFVTEPFKNGTQVGQVFETLATGVKGSGMVAFTYLPEEERWALAYYVLFLRAGGK
jgi:mono/diheme cytochrome c family protein